MNSFLTTAQDLVRPVSKIRSALKQYLIPNYKYPVPSSQYQIPYTLYAIPNTQYQMSNYSTHPRILFVTPEAVFRPERGGKRTYFIDVNRGSFDNFPAELINELFELGVDVHVAQPDFRNIFKTRSHQEKSGKGGKPPCDRFYLAEDRAFFYSKPINSNFVWENIKISLAFQREVINQILPRIQPDLIHYFFKPIIASIQLIHNHMTLCLVLKICESNFRNFSKFHRVV
jgi:hypothetical protein